MSDSKIQIKIGPIEFSGEGNQNWIGAQLDKILEKAPDLLKNSSLDKKSNDQSDFKNNSHKAAPKNLVTFLKDKGATTNQIKKFLVTATFLQLNGKARLSTSDVVKALKDSNQSRLGNPSDCLTKNITKGFCEKNGKDFFVTTEGLKELSINIEE